jgi:4'-phosphopantetheinyl transferase
VIPDIGLWQSAPEHLSIEQSTLHLWRISIDSLLPSLNHLQKLLSIDEITRANRLIDVTRRQRFIITRASLRTILGQYLKVSPATVHFSYNQHGKPFLDSHPNSLFFNLSHSEEKAVIAIATEKNVGIDLEKINYTLNYRSIADQYFTLKERLCLNRYPKARKQRAFYRLWTQKEALLKAAGTGFHTTDFGTDYANEKLTIRTFPFNDSYICSCVTDSVISQICRFDLSLEDISSRD